MCLSVHFELVGPEVMDSWLPSCAQTVTAMGTAQPGRCIQNYEVEVLHLLYRLLPFPGVQKQNMLYAETLIRRMPRLQQDPEPSAATVQSNMPPVHP